MSSRLNGTLVKLHKSCYNIYKYSSLMLPAIIFAD